MAQRIEFVGEAAANEKRGQIQEVEPIALRTFTPTLAILNWSAGLYHFTPDGRRLADFTSGVLVANLGHHPKAWLKRFFFYIGLQSDEIAAIEKDNHPELDDFLSMPPWTAYNAASVLEVDATCRLLANLKAATGGRRMEKVLWSASGSEGIQKALWACLKFQPAKDVILATRHGFHGKKGLAEAVTGDENSPNRDPRVHFISFPKDACRDISMRDEPFDVAPICAELESLKQRFGGRINCLITEPYLGGGGSFHPPKEYQQALMRFCRDNDIVFVLDEVQSNFGRTGNMYAFESYEIEPDLVVLGKGMGNGVPVNAVVGRADVLDSLQYGEASDTWSAHPLGCAATLATLDIFEKTGILMFARRAAKRLEEGLRKLKELPHVAAVRGEGMVWGVEFAADPPGGKRTRTANQVANDAVELAYIGDDDGNAIHLLGPLNGNVVRIAPPLSISDDEADFWTEALFNIWRKLAR